MARTSAAKGKMVTPLAAAGLLSDDGSRGVAPTPLYPGLYGWEVAYQLPNGSVTFCSCFRETWNRYFNYLRDELAASFLRTHRQQIEGKRLLHLAFSRFASHMHPAALKAYFPTCAFSTHPQSAIDGKVFFFGNDQIDPPELDVSFWETPKKLFLFEDETCEVCTGRVPRHFYCHQMYGGPFIQIYGAWVRAEVIRQGYIDQQEFADKANHHRIWKEAENKVRAIVGVPHIGEKFISETILFKTVAYLLKNHEVIHHYRAAWLGRQELDIFIPSLNLAVEYQGEQHFESINAWGGDDALEKTQQRDEEKRRRCESEGVKLIYFDHTMELTEKFVARRLDEALAKPPS